MKKIKIALQKSGRLNEGSIKLLKDCGININNEKGQLRASSYDFPIEVYYLRNSDIPKYVEDGVADLAVVGQNLLEEKKPDVEILRDLGFSKCRLSIAVPKNSNIKTIQDLNGKRIASSYQNSLTEFLNKNNISAQIHKISGSVEIAPNIGLSDAICDLVSSGNTLYKNGLRELETILESQACLIKSHKMSPEKDKLLQYLLFRINSVLAARESKYILMNAPNDRIKEILAILPVMRSPTVLPLADKDWSSVHSVVIEDKNIWKLAANLKKLGAEDILISSIEKMIL